VSVGPTNPPPSTSYKHKCEHRVLHLLDMHLREKGKKGQRVGKKRGRKRKEESKRR